MDNRMDNSGNGHPVTTIYLAFLAPPEGFEPSHTV